MPIQMPEKPKSGLQKILGIGEIAAGAVTGQPELIVAGAGSLTSGSPLGKAAGIASTGMGIADKVNQTPAGSDSATPTNIIGTPNVDGGVDTPTSAMDRRLASAPDKAFQNDPAQYGLNLLQQHGQSLDHETFMTVLEPLLRAQHFGIGGGLNDSPNLNNTGGMNDTGSTGVA